MQLVWLIVLWSSALLTAYVQFGYALVTLLLARLVRRRVPPVGWSELPHVTLIVPAYNEERWIEAKLRNCLAIDYPPDRLEIILASDGSSDRTIEIAQQFDSPQLRILDTRSRRGKAAVVNDAVQQSSGRILCLCDANVMFRPDALCRMVDRLSDPRVGAVTGDVRLASEDSNFGEGEKAYYQLERRLQTGESQIGSVMGVDGGMYVIRRELYRQLPHDTILDDLAISMYVIRQGHRVIYEPAAVATENATPKATQEFRRRVRVSAGAVQLLRRGAWPTPWTPMEFWQFVSHKLLRWMQPFWLIGLLVANIGLLSRGRPYEWLLWAQLAAYAIAGGAVFSLTLRGTRLGGVVFYFLMSNAAMLVGYLKGVLNLQRVTWQRTERTTVPSNST